MDENTTTNQVIPNPEGKGGFGDNPQNRSNGRWKSEDSQHYCLNMFLHMSLADFKQWEKDHPENSRTVAQSLAYARIVNARLRLADYKEVTDRTEGQAKQVVENLNDDSPAIKLLEKIFDEKGK
jgi:hypothetical protein